MPHRTLVTLAAVSMVLLLAACAPNAPLPGPTPIAAYSGPQPTLDPRLSAANISAGAGKPGDASAGQALFQRSCSACHGIEGEGLSAPSLKTSAFVRGARDEEIFVTIAQGRVAKGMPAWSSAAGGLFSDIQIRDLVAYVRELQK
jgi:mono/diheme cytochrome c family protein